MPTITTTGSHVVVKTIIVAVAGIISILNARAEWVFTDTYSTDNEYDALIIPKYVGWSGSLSPYSGGTAYQYLDYNSGQLGKYYISLVDINVNCSSYYYTGAVSRIMDGTRQWRWQWNGSQGGEQGQIFEYNVRGKIVVDVHVDVDPGGHGYFDSFAWVNVSAATSGWAGEDASTDAIALAEVVEDDYSITGLGISITGGGNIVWDEPDPQAYDANKGTTEYAPIDGLPWAGTICYVQIQTSSEAHAGSFSDTNHVNEATGTSSLDLGYSLHVLQAPYAP